MIGRRSDVVPRWRPAFLAAAALLTAVGLAGAASRAEAAFPGANGKIVFMSSRNGPGNLTEIFSIDPDGTDLTQLTTTSGAFEFEPDVSADGSKIAFSSDADGDYEIYSMNVDGTGRIQLTNNPAHDAHPSWSPDGSKIVFSRGGNQLYTINANGSGEQLVEPGPNSLTPEWSPDGTKIVFHANRNGSNVDIFTIDATGGGLTRLTTDPQRDLLPDWSPDGSKIAFISDRVCAPFCYSQVWVMNADGSDQTALTSTAPQQNEWPAWSPDGTQIVFSRTDASGSWDLYRMNADGSGVTVLADVGTFNMHADWAIAPPSSLEITNVVETANSVSRYARFEASFELSETFDNPFDPEEIAVDVTFTAPSGRTQTVPAFWYQPFTVAGSPDFEQYVPAADPGWRIRFAPDEVGTYGYSIAAVAGSETATSVTGSFESTASARSGFVRVDERNPRYLRYDNDAPYVPVGHNVAFEDFPPLNGTGYYANQFSTLDSAGENWTRVWMTDFNRSALEWGPGHYSGFYDGPGVYSLPSAWRMDRILELAEQHGLTVQLVLNDHGQFSTWVNARWQVRCAESDTPPCEPGDEGYDPGNAYSSTNGGPVDAAAPQEFFSDPEARELFKQRLRYLVGRYGAYTSLLAWELFNEVQFIGTNAINAYGDAGVRAAIVSWHEEMSEYLSSIDPHDHLVTTSSWDPTGTPDLWSLPELDVVQIHTYSSPPTSRTAEIRDLVAQLKSSLDKPVHVGELGIGSGDPEAGFDPATFGGTTANREHLVEGTHLHNALWAGALSESGAAYWWWGIYMTADPAKNRTAPKFPLHQRHMPPLNAYLAGEDWAPLGLDTPSLSVTGGITAVGVNSASQAFLWVRDTQNEYGTGARPGDLVGRSIVGATVHVGGMDDGVYQVRVFDTWGAGGVTSTFEAGASGGILTVPLPSFTRDIALKIDFLGPSGRRTEDAPDDLAGKQIHLVYAIPWDGEDRELDLDGTIADSVGVIQGWLAEQADGRKLRLDTVGGEPDITFFQLSRTDEEIADEGAFVRDAIEDELVAAGFDDPDKVYAVHYDGTSTFSCGGGAWPPTLPGTVAALYLHGLPDGPVPCEGNPFAGEGGSPGYWEYSWLHEIVHTLGFVAECAPNHTLAGHVSEPNHDLMWAGTTGFWDLSDVVLDEGNDDYFGHDDPTCLDLAESPFLADVAQETVPPGGTVTTDPDGDSPSATDPVEASVTTPNGGTVTIDEGIASGAAPAGFTFLGQQIVISAPPATAGSPLRLVFSVHPSLIPAGESVQTLQIFRDGALVGECPGSTTASPNPCVSERLELGDGTARMTVLTSQASTWNLGVSGSTLAASCAASPPAGAILGTAGKDKLTGNAANNVIYALGGDDTIDGGGGHDVVCGGAGRDKIGGGAGDDAVDGGPGADQIDGGAGNDKLVGAEGNDALSGGAGNDTADGGPGSDSIDGGPGTDTCRGESRKACER